MAGTREPGITVKMLALVDDNAPAGSRSNWQDARSTIVTRMGRNVVHSSANDVVQSPQLE